MPADEPTSRAGDTGPSGATFRGGVERVDGNTAGVPAVPPRHPDDPSPGGAGRAGEDPVGPTRSTSAPTQVDRPGTGSGPTTAASTAAHTGRPTGPGQARPGGPGSGGGGRSSGGGSGPRGRRVRARKVRRVLRHVEPWSVLKLSVLFYAALFLIVCVASALLWGAARSTGTVDNVESFITSVGGFGNCEPIDGEAPVTTTTLPGAITTAPVDQLDPNAGSTTVPEGSAAAPAPGDDEDCRAGEKLVGEFKFEDGRIFQAFILGGIVLVLAGSAANVVMVLLFNLMSDLTGGLRVTVLEEDGQARPRSPSGSPPPPRRD